MIVNLFKPKLQSVPLATGLRWRGDRFLFQEKSDGRHEFAAIGRAIVNAERMAGGELVVNDLVETDGQDMRREPTRVRWAELLGLSRMFAGNIRLCRTGPGGEFLERLLSEGGEGVVAKPFDAPFGTNWWKCKRCQVFLCRVCGLDHARGSAELADAASGQPRGKLALRSRFEQVRLGSVLKVEAFGEHRSGLLREARLDRDSNDSWLASF